MNHLHFLLAVGLIVLLHPDCHAQDAEAKSLPTPTAAEVKTPQPDDTDVVAGSQEAGKQPAAQSAERTARSAGSTHSGTALPITIELPHDPEFAVKIWQFAEDMNTNKASVTVESPDVRRASATEIEADLRIRRGVTVRTLDRLIQDLRAFGITRFRFAVGDNSVIITAPSLPALKTIRGLTDYHPSDPFGDPFGDPFKIDVRVRQNDDPPTSTQLNSVAMSAVEPHAQSATRSVPNSQTGTTEQSVKVFQLRNSSVANAIGILSQIYSVGVTMAADERTNSLIARGEAPRLLEIEALLTRLDDPNPAKPVAPQSASVKADPWRQLVDRDAAVLAMMAGNSVATLRKSFEEADQRARELATRNRAALKEAGGTDYDEQKIRYAELRQAVREAFRLRQQLHGVELAEFAKRLEGIRQSVEIRNRIADQIIDRRVEDLLNPDLQWETAATTAAPTTAASGVSPDALPQAASRESQTLRPAPIWRGFAERNSQAASREAPSSRRGAGDLRILYKEYGRIQWIDGPGSLMRDGRGGSFQIPLGSTIKLRLSDIPKREGAAAFVSLESAAANPKTTRFLMHNSIPLQITTEDWDQINRGQVLTKAVFLPHDLTAAGDDLIEVVTSSRLDPGIDPIDEAERRGTLIATVRMGTQSTAVFDYSRNRARFTPAGTELEPAK